MANQDVVGRVKIRLLLILKNPLTARDYDRMGLSVLNQNFDLTVLDCSPWLMPRTSETRVAEVPCDVSLVIIRSMGELKSFLAGVRGGFAVDYVGQFSSSAVLLFDQLKRAGFKLVAIDHGSFPIPKEWRRISFSYSALVYAAKCNFLGRAVKAIWRRILLKVLPDQALDVAFVAGDSWKSDPRFLSAKTKIPAHSFDYQKYMNVNELPLSSSGKYAVYIDEKLPFHEDNAELGYGPPVSADKFGAAIRGFFTQFEELTGLQVKVAGYPSFRERSLKGFYGDRVVEIGRTAELIREAEIVFAHASTAISFAVLWKRPIVLLVTRELQDSWYFPWVKAPMAMLHLPLVDIDQPLTEMEISNWTAGIDQNAYRCYEMTHLKASDGPDDHLWSIFSNALYRLS